jgi:pimeloyl-ACP methyl ester carboxylesterase
LPAIASFTKQQFLNRDALVALIDKVGRAVLMTRSQGGAFGWPVADARPDKVKAILAIEPNGPPGRGLEFIGAPDYFKEGKLALTYGITSVPITYAPALADPSELKFVKEDKPDGPGLATCWKQAEPARQLTRLKMPIMVLTSEASYHAPYDHCAVKFLEQAGVKPSFIRLMISASRATAMCLEEQQGDRRGHRRLARQDVQGVIGAPCRYF